MAYKTTNSSYQLILNLKGRVCNSMYYSGINQSVTAIKIFL